MFDATAKRAPGVPHHTFDIEGPSDAQELIKELESKAIKTDGMRLHGRGPGYSVYVIDPGGNRIELPKTKTRRCNYQLKLPFANRIQRIST